MLAKGRAPLSSDHLRFQTRKAEAGVLHCLVLDCSGSMLKRHSLSLAKGLLAHWSSRIYRERGELMVISFSGNRAQVLRHAGRAVAFNDRWIEPIGGGGSSPAGSGSALAERMLAGMKRKAPGRTTALWLLSDGRFDPLPERPQFADSVGVVDFESATIRLGRMARLARQWGATYQRAEDVAQLDH